MFLSPPTHNNWKVPGLEKLAHSWIPFGDHAEGVDPLWAVPSWYVDLPSGDRITLTYEHGRHGPWRTYDYTGLQTSGSAQEAVDLLEERLLHDYPLWSLQHMHAREQQKAKENPGHGPYRSAVISMPSSAQLAGGNPKGPAKEMRKLHAALKAEFPSLVGVPDAYRPAWVAVDEDREYVEFVYDEDEAAPELIDRVRQYLSSQEVVPYNEEYGATWVREYFAPVSSLREQFDPRKDVAGVWVHVFNKKVPQGREDWREFLSISGEVSVSSWDPEIRRDYFTRRGATKNVAVLLEGTASLCWEGDVWSLMADSGLRYPTRPKSPFSTHDECFLVPKAAKAVGLLLGPEVEPALAARAEKAAREQGIRIFRASLRSLRPRRRESEARRVEEDMYEKFQLREGMGRRARSNPKGAPREFFDPREMQLAAQRLGIYESELRGRDPRKMTRKALDEAVSKAFGGGTKAARRVPKPKRVKGTDLTVARGAFLSQEGAVPTERAIRASRQRYAGNYVGANGRVRTLTDLVETRQAYELMLAMRRKNRASTDFYRVSLEPAARGHLRYFVWPLPPEAAIPGPGVSSKEEAEAIAADLNRRVNPFKTGVWWAPLRAEYTRKDLAHWLPPASVFTKTYNPFARKAAPARKRRRTG